MLGHTAATLLIETGVDIRIVQRFLGHSSIAATEIYTYVSAEALRTTLERADVLATLVPAAHERVETHLATHNPELWTLEMWA